MRKNNTTFFPLVSFFKFLFLSSLFFGGAVTTFAAGDVWVEKTSAPSASSNYVNVVGKFYSPASCWWGSCQGDLIYDPVSDSWAATIRNPRNRYGFGLQSLGGKVYILGGVWFGGYESNAVDEYDPSTDTWSEKASMNYSRQQPYSFIINNKLYALYGTGCSSSSNACSVNVNEEYDPATNIWTIKNSPPWRDIFSAPFRPVVIGTKMHELNIVSWGTNSGNDHWGYDQLTDTWTAKAKIPQPLSGFTAVPFNEKIYVFGGYLQKDCPTNQRCIYDMYNLTQVYDLLTDSWSNKTPMNFPRGDAGGVIIKDKIYIIGGHDWSTWDTIPDVYYKTEEYDPNKDTWQIRSNNPGYWSWNAYGNFGRLFGYINEKIYLLPFGSYFFSTYEYTPPIDPVVKVWFSN